jgi:Tol biopolymer transport system component
MLRLLAILGVALLGLGLLTGCAAEEEGATATTSPTAAVVTTPAAIPSPGATPTATPKATATPTPTPTATPAAGLGKLAFVRDGDIWLLDVDSGQERQLTSDGGNMGPRWSPDGRWLAFVKAEAGAIWLMREDGSDASLVAESASGSPIWAPGEDRLAYVTSEGVLGLLDVESGEQQELAGPDWEVSRFAWQPDGERLAIERWIEGEELTPPPNTTVDQGIWLLNADGSDLTKLYGLYQRSQLGPVAYLGGWSPDSKRITFWQADIISASLLADGAPLLVLPVEGGEPQEIASFALLEPGFVAWSPQGDRLAVVEGGGRETWVNKQIVVMQPDGSDRRVLSDAGRADLFPAWSPDGQSIAFASGESGYELTAPTSASSPTTPPTPTSSLSGRPTARTFSSSASKRRRSAWKPRWFQSKFGS